jgi:perosamine synthetase
MSGWLTQGPKVAAFEKLFAERHQVPHALAVSSCTTGLHLILAAIGIGPGDEVIVPAFTWIASANVVVYCGATPVFVDVDRTSFNLDQSDLARRISPRTKAIIAVHLFGMTADIDAIREVAPGVPIIEDAACAAGASYKGKPAGGLGLAAAFSFHPRKSITTGEGGMITTRDSALAETMNVLRNHGASMSEEQRHKGPRPYILPDFNLLGFNYRMTDLQGALGLVQLGKLDRFIKERNEAANYYRDALSDINWIRTPVCPPHMTHAWQAFVCYVNPEEAPANRNQIMEKLQEKGISTRPGTHAIHLLGYYRKRFAFDPVDYPAAYDCDAHSMAIPLHNRMSQDDYAYVVRALRAID